MSISPTERSSCLPPTVAAEREPARYRGGDFREERDLEQVHLVLGFEGIGYRDPDFYPLSVLSTLLGGGMSSRLFQEAREKRGLVYSIYSFPASYTDTGLFGIYAGTGEDEVEELVPLVCDELRKVVLDVGEAEISRARAQLKSGMLMALESTSARCEQLARQLMIFGRPVPIAESVARIEAVDRRCSNGCGTTAVQRDPDNGNSGSDQARRYPNGSSIVAFRYTVVKGFRHFR